MSTQRYRALTAADGNMRGSDEVAYGRYSEIWRRMDRAPTYSLRQKYIGKPLSLWLDDGGISKARRPIATKTSGFKRRTVPLNTAREALEGLRQSLAAEQLQTQRLRRALNSIQVICKETLK